LVDFVYSIGSLVPNTEVREDGEFDRGVDDVEAWDIVSYTYSFALDVGHQILAMAMVVQASVAGVLLVTSFPTPTFISLNVDPHNNVLSNLLRCPTQTHNTTPVQYSPFLLS